METRSDGIEYVKGRTRIMIIIIDLIILQIVSSVFGIAIEDIPLKPDVPSHIQHNIKNKLINNQTKQITAEEARYIKENLQYELTISIIKIIFKITYLSLFCSIIGATPAKLFFKVKIIDQNTLEPPRLSKAILRYVSAFILVIPMGLGVLTIFFSSRRQALYDKIAGTIVVKTATLPKEDTANKPDSDYSPHEERQLSTDQPPHQQQESGEQESEKNQIQSENKMKKKKKKSKK